VGRDSAYYLGLLLDGVERSYPDPRRFLKRDAELIEATGDFWWQLDGTEHALHAPGQRCPYVPALLFSGCLEHGRELRGVDS